MELQYRFGLPIGSAPYNQPIGSTGKYIGAPECAIRGAMCPLPGERSRRPDRSTYFFSFHNFQPVPIFPASDRHSKVTWQRTHWGTTHDAADHVDDRPRHKAVQDAPGLEQLEFFLAWRSGAIPHQIVQAISAQFPDLLVINEFGSGDGLTSKKVGGLAILQRGQVAFRKDIEKAFVEKDFQHWPATIEVDNQHGLATAKCVAIDAFFHAARDSGDWPAKLRQINQSGPSELVRLIVEWADIPGRLPSGIGAVDAAIAAPGISDASRATTGRGIDPHRVLALANYCATHAPLAAFVGSDAGVLANGLHAVAIMAHLVAPGSTEDSGLKNILARATFTLPTTLASVLAESPSASLASPLPRSSNSETQAQASDPRMSNETMRIRTVMTLYSSGNPVAWRFLGEKAREALLPDLGQDFILWSSICDPAATQVFIDTYGIRATTSAIRRLSDTMHRSRRETEGAFIERLPLPITAAARAVISAAEKADRMMTLALTGAGRTSERRQDRPGLQ
jgi:hypothetical protein